MFISYPLIYPEREDPVVRFVENLVDKILNFLGVENPADRAKRRQCRLVPLVPMEVLQPPADFEWNATEEVTWRTETDESAQLRARLQAEHETVVALRAQLQAEEDAVVALRAQLQAEQDKARCELQAERDAAIFEQSKADAQRTLLQLELAIMRRQNAAAEEREKHWLDECKQLQQNVDDLDHRCRSFQLKMHEAIRMKDSDAAISANMDKMLKAQVKELSAETATLRRQKYELEAQLAAALRNDESRLEVARNTSGASNTRAETPAGGRLRRVFVDFGNVLEHVGILEK